MLKEDIDLVESVMLDGGVWSNKRAAWFRLKTILVEGANLQPPTKQAQNAG